MRKIWTIWTLGGALLLLPVAMVGAQKAAAPNAGFTNTAGRLEITSDGARLTAEGNTPARFTSSQFDVSAQVINLVYKNNQVTQVRANGNVRLKANLATQGNQPARIESTSSQASLNPTTRVLTLTGNVKGNYQIGNGPQNTLQGDKAVLSYVNKVINADVTGAQGVTLVVPANGLPQAGGLDVGTVTITAQRALVEEGKTARFIGKAHAVSSGGTNGFDVTADEFALARDSNGTMQNLTTVGRTHISLDLPPEPASADATPVTVTANATIPTPAGASGNSNNGGIIGNVGRPTHVDAYADKAVLVLLTRTLTLDGNVTGSYQLAPPGGVPSTYKFTGEKAVLRSVAQEKATGGALGGFSANFSGTPEKPAQVQGPPLNLGLD